MKWKFNFENNLRVKQHNFHRRRPIILKKLVWRPCGGRLGDDPPDPPLELPLVEGGISPMLIGGINAPAWLRSLQCFDTDG